MSETPEDYAVGATRGRKSVAWRRDRTILARLDDVERLYLAGRSNYAIAASVGVTEGTIRTDLKRLAELWLERTQGEQAALRSAKLAELHDIKRRALAAAEFDETAERAVLFGEDADGGRLGVIGRGPGGAAQFRGNKAAALQVARQAIMDAAKLQGLVVDKLAPTKGDGSDLDLATLVLKAREGREDGPP